MKKFTGIGNIVVAGFFIAMTSISVFLPSFTLSESIRDYMVHILFFLLVSGLLGLIVNSKVILYSGFGCAAALALFLKSASNDELKNPALNEEDKITVSHINLSVVTDEIALIELIRKNDPDVIAFQEYTPNWAALLPTMIDTTFRYVKENVRIDLYGKALYSKYPILDEKELVFEDIPNIDVTINKRNKIFRLISAYMTPALDNFSKAKAKIQFDILQTYLKKSASHTVVSGEFNQVYWSGDILSFRKNTALLNSRRTVNPSSLKMPYDHIFYSSDLECYQFNELMDESNTHVGCLASFQIKKTASLRNRPK